MMKIMIRENGHSIVIRLPNFLLTTSIGEKWLKNRLHVHLNRSQLKQIAKALHLFKKQCNLPLVEVISEKSQVIVQW